MAAMDSGTAFVTSRLQSLDEEAPDQTLAPGTTGFEESLAALRLDGISKPFMEIAYSCAESGMSHTSGVAVEEDEIRLLPPFKADKIDIIDTRREQLLSAELPRFDSTSSMRSLMTDSIFSTGTTCTTYSCPPSPSSSAHVAEPLHCGSWNLNPHHVADTPCRVNAWSALRTGGEKSGVYVHDWSFRSRA